MIINAASSCWSGLKIKDAVEKIVNGETFEPLLGTISSNHIQICPQHINYFDEDVADDLVNRFPQTQFRLHADVRLKNKRGYSVDLSDFNQDTKWYFEELSQYSKKLGSKAYSLHAGKRKVSLGEFKEQYLSVQEIFGNTKVVVEGLYPTAQKKWIIDCWEEYVWLAENNIPYALDLSHLKILEKKFGAEDNLIKELIDNDLCEEIHISFNDGILDSHEIAQTKFQSTFDKYCDFLKNKKAHSVIFTEGNQVLHQIKEKKKNTNV